MKSKSVASILVVLFVAIAVVGRDANDDLKLIQGTWIPIEGELAGQRLTEEALQIFKLTIADGFEYTGVIGYALEKGTIKLDAMAMDLVALDGPKNSAKFMAIYELSGDHLTICYDLSGTFRPSGFKTRPNSQLFLVKYKREKV